MNEKGGKRILLFLVLIFSVWKTNQNRVDEVLDRVQTENKLKPEWGTNFRYQGKLTHNLDRVWIVTKVPIPKIDDLLIKPLNATVNCTGITQHPITNFEEEEVTAHLCRLVLPHLTWIQKKEENHRKRLASFFAHDLYQMLPSLEPLDRKPPVGRSKRWVGSVIGAMAGLVTLGVEHLSNHLHLKRQRALKKACFALDEGQTMVRNSLKQLEEDFLMYGEYEVESLEGIVRTINSLHNRTTWLERAFTDRIMLSKYVSERSWEGHILFTAHSQQYLLAISEEHDTIYEKLHLACEKLLRAPEKLSRGYFPLPSVLSKLVREVEEKIQKSHPEYTLTLDKLSQYYDLKLVTYGVDPRNHSFIVTFPVFIEHHTNKALYEIDSIPVPITDLNTEADSVSQVHLRKPYFAVNQDFYIQLRLEEMSMCKEVNFEYFCKELFSVKHREEHHLMKVPCSSLIQHRQY